MAARWTITFLSAFTLAADVLPSELVAQSRAVRITADSIGGVPLWIPLADVERRWAGAKRGAWYGYEIGYRAVEFTVGRSKVWAVQAKQAAEEEDTLPSLDLTKAPDFYAIEGTTGELPGGMPTGATWARLRPALGEVKVYAEGSYPVHVRPCRYPWLTLGFNNRYGVAALNEPRAPDGSHPPSILPDSARPQYVLVYPTDRGSGTPGAVHCGSR